MRHAARLPRRPCPRASASGSELVFRAGETVRAAVHARLRQRAPLRRRPSFLHRPMARRRSSLDVYAAELASQGLSHWLWIIAAGGGPARSCISASGSTPTTRCAFRNRRRTSSSAAAGSTRIIRCRTCATRSPTCTPLPEVDRAKIGVAGPRPWRRTCADFGHGDGYARASRRRHHAGHSRTGRGRKVLRAGCGGASRDDQARPRGRAAQDGIRRESAQRG